MFAFTAVEHHPTWVRGVRRAAEIVLMEKGVADDQGAADADTDGETARNPPQLFHGYL